MVSDIPSLTVLRVYHNFIKVVFRKVVTYFLGGATVVVEAETTGNTECLSESNSSDTRGIHQTGGFN